MKCSTPIWAVAAFVSAIASHAPADVQVFTNYEQFQFVTGASAQPPLPNLGLVGHHIASVTVGDLTFSINDTSRDISLSLADFTALNPGNEIGMDDWEALDVTSAMPVYALGSYFIEGTGPEFCSTSCPCVNATYQVRVFMDSTLVGDVQFNAPDNVVSFIGVAATEPFNRVEFRDLSRGCDNEYWGQFFTATQPLCLLITTQPVDAITCPDTPAPFSITTSGPGPYIYSWQVEASPDSWLTIGNDPMPLGCGGNSSFITAQPFNSPSTNIRVHGCPGPFNIRALATTPCGTATSQIAKLSICATDVNCDHVVDFFDYLDFVQAFAAGSQSADFNLDHVVDLFDYLDFVDALADGC